MKALRILTFVIVMGTVSGALLVGVNVYTAPMISRNEELRLKSSVLDALEIPYAKEEAINKFDQAVTVSAKDARTFYRSADGSTAFEFRGPGLWGPISGIISLERDLKTVRRIKVLHQEETPGLGGRIAEADFLQRFKQKEFSPRIKFMPEGTAVNKDEVDAITGATGSSRAFEKLINETVQKHIAALRG